MPSNITIAINGNNQVTDRIYSEDFNIDRKFEYEFSDLKSSDGFIALPISKLNPVSKVYAESDGSLEIKFDYGSTTNSVYISGVAYICIDPNYANISGVSIGTSSTSSVNGNISVLRLV